MCCMRDLIAELALRVYIFCKGENEMMPMLYASKIVMEAINPKTKDRKSVV